MSGQSIGKKKNAPNQASAPQKRADILAPAALRLEQASGRSQFASSEGFPAALRPLCDPALLLADLADEGAPLRQATVLRGYWVSGEPIALAVRARLTEQDEREATALAIPAALFLESGAGIVAALPALLDQAERSLGSADLAAVLAALKPESRPKTRANAEAAAARLLTALGETEAHGATARLEAADEAGFWRGVAALIRLLPGAAGLGLSAVFSDETTPLRPGAALLRPAVSPPAPPAGAQKAAAEIFGALEDGALTPPRGGAQTAPLLEAGLDAALVDRFCATLAASGPAETMRAYALEPEASPPEAGTAAEILLTAGAAAEMLRTGRAGAAVLPPFGAARCLGWLAARPDASAFWPSLLSRAPALADWRALSLAEPAEAGPIHSLSALARLDWAEAEARKAVPEGVETPFDAPVYAERLAQAAAAGPDLLIEDPLALTSPDLQLARFAKLLEGVEPKTLARPIDALELSAETPPRECSKAALARLERAARALRKGSGLSALGRYDRPPVGADHPQAAQFFGACWLHCLGVGAWGGAAFWRDRFFAWIEERSASETDAVEDALTGLRRLAERLGEAGAHVLCEPRLAADGVDDRKAASQAEPSPPPPARKTPPPPQEPRAHLSPDALQEAMAALRKGAEEESEEVGPEAEDLEVQPVPQRRKKRAAPAPDAAALSLAEALIAEFLEDFAAEAERRAAGGDAQALELDQSGATGGKKGFGAAIDAAASLALDSPKQAEERFGAPVAWSLRQLAGLGRKPAARPAFEPAPDAVRRVWANLGAVLKSPGEEAAFLGLLGKLLAAQRRKRLGANLVADGLLSALPALQVTRMIGSDSISFSKTTLRDYLFGGRRGESKSAIEALEDAEVAARFDRALLFFALLNCAEDPLEDPTALLEPYAIAPEGAEIRALTPPDAVLLRLGSYLSEGRAPSSAHGAAFEALMERRGLVHNTALAQLWRKLPRRG